MPRISPAFPRRLWVLTFACALVLSSSAQQTATPATPAPASSQSSPAPAPASPAPEPTYQLPPLVIPELAPLTRPTPAQVTLSDRDLFPITAAIGSFSPADRAAATSRKLQQLLDDPKATPDSITTVNHETGTDVVARDLVLTTVTDRDSDFDALGRTRFQLANAHANDMRQAMRTVREEYSASSLSIGALKSAAAALLLVIIFVILHFIFPVVYRAIQSRRGTRIRTIRIQSLELLTEERITDILIQTARVLRFAISVVLLYFFIPLVFSFFAPTRGFGHTLVEYVLAPVHRGGHAFAVYLPKMLVVVVIVFFTFQALRLARFLFREVERGTIVWPGFYPEWAMPTSRIIELLLIAFALVIAFPYLPGSNSDAFKGVSIFLGVLLSLGSSTVIANVVAGVLLTYTRAFRIGDRVQIADTTGDVIEKTLLATHLRTIKNVDVTVPNGLVLASHIINFSRSTPDRPLILNTPVTIGYDVDWRRVHEILLAAAAATPDVLLSPPPFVLQTSLDDFYVSYQINAYTSAPTRMAEMYSDLNREILDGFNSAGIEIMSPHYQVQRHTQSTTVPEEYLGPTEPQDHRRHPKTAEHSRAV